MDLSDIPDDLWNDEEDEAYYSTGLCVPQDPIGELEWFPSFSNDLISLHNNNNQQLPPQNTTTGSRLKPIATKKQRSKRVFNFRPPAAYRWFLLTTEENKKKRCSHCQTDKTPQWRMGPLGPKTLCNACGVRYKSGRLVAEYRPASSPTFNSFRHSNFHKKILKRKGFLR